MPKTVLSESPHHRTEYHRDAHDESGTVYSRKIFYDDQIAEANKEIRNEGKIRTGKKSPIHRGSEIVYLFRINPLQWADFKRRHPQIVESLHSRDALQREKAAADIRSMHPEWVVAAPRKSA